MLGENVSFSNTTTTIKLTKEQAMKDENFSKIMNAFFRTSTRGEHNISKYNSQMTLNNPSSMLLVNRSTKDTRPRQSVSDKKAEQDVEAILNGIYGENVDIEHEEKDTISLEKKNLILASSAGIYTLASSKTFSKTAVGFINKLKLTQSLSFL